MIYDIQRASVWKRISAFLFDVILLSILAVGVAFLLSSVTGYDKRLDAHSAKIEELQKKYGIDLTVSATEYNALSEEQKALYDQAIEEFNGDPEMISNYNLVVNLSLVIVTGSILISFLILEFFIPLFAFKNGRTVGKKVFGIALIRSNGVKINGPVLFIRTVLGKYAIETMISAYIIIMFIFGKADFIMIILLFLIPVVNVILLLATHNHTPIHDLLSGTVAVDFASQMIFDTEEDLIAYKQKVHSEMVENDRERG